MYRPKDSILGHLQSAEQCYVAVEGCHDGRATSTRGHSDCRGQGRRWRDAGAIWSVGMGQYYAPHNGTINWGSMQCFGLYASFLSLFMWELCHFLIVHVIGYVCIIYIYIDTYIHSYIHRYCDSLSLWISYLMVYGHRYCDCWIDYDWLYLYCSIACW